jgi:two-component system response regulator YesN
MQAGLASPVRIDDIAREIATSRRQLQRCFTDHAGESFRECVQRLRMERAAELFEAYPERTIREVALSVGYRQPPQFAKAFRRHHGVAPGEFRRSKSRDGRLIDGQDALA